MRPFEYRREHDLEAASRAVRAHPAAQFIAGGTNLTDYMTLDVMHPPLLVDINQSNSEYARIDSNDDRLRLGALLRMGQVEDHPVINHSYPVIAQSLKLAASRQIRNLASLGGNLLQRTRCEYFRGRAWPCNKRHPGSGCAALEGLNRQHAILGTSEHCIAVYAGDFAQALVALEACLETIGGPSGPRRFPFTELHRLPGDTPHLETTLAPGELITYIDVPAGPWTRRSLFVKVRDRRSYQFALASAAVAMDLADNVVSHVRIALGGVATVPWRAREAEAILEGRKLDEPLAVKAADAAFVDARQLQHNGFKVPLGKQTLVRALLEASAMQV